MNEKIAILLPVYNAEQFLRECLDSIIAQTYTEWRLLACNDGSKDSSLKILNEYAAKDHRIIILDNPENMGIVKTLNRLLDAVPEDINFIARLDADDICLYDRLERQLAFLEAHPSIGGVGSSLIIINEKSQVTGRRIYPCQKEEIRRKLPYSNQLAHPSMMLLKESIRKAGYYSSGYNGCEDYELWLRMLEYADFSNLAEPVIKYRISSGQCKQQHLKSTLKNTVKIQREYFKRIGHRIPFTLFVQHWVGFVLLLLPSQWILTLFCLLAYKKQDK